MNKLFFALAVLAFLVQACAQNTEENIEKNQLKKIRLPEVQTNFALSDYLSENAGLDKEVDAIFKSLDDTAIVAQLIMPAIGRLGQTEATIKSHIKQRIIGGVLMLNGTKKEFTDWISMFNTMNDTIQNVPFLYSDRKSVV